MGCVPKPDQPTDPPPQPAPSHYLLPLPPSNFPLLTSHFQLLTSHFQLPTSHFQLLTSHFSLLTSHFPLPTSNFSLPPPAPVAGLVQPQGHWLARSSQPCTLECRPWRCCLSLRFASPYGRSGASRKKQAHHRNWNEGNRLGDDEGALSGPNDRSHDEPKDADVYEFS